MDDFQLDQDSQDSFDREAKEHMQKQPTASQQTQQQQQPQLFDDDIPLEFSINEEIDEVIDDIIPVTIEKDADQQILKVVDDEGQKPKVDFGAGFQINEE